MLFSGLQLSTGTTLASQPPSFRDLCVSTSLALELQACYHTWLFSHMIWESPEELNYFSHP